MEEKEAEEWNEIAGMVFMEGFASGAIVGGTIASALTLAIIFIIMSC